MKNQKTIIIAAAAAILVILVIIFSLNKSGTNKSEQSGVATGDHPYNFKGKCPGETTTETMADDMMAGIIEKDKEYKLVHSYYWCNQVERGDIVSLQFSSQLDPVVRKVYGIPGDKFEVSFNKKQNAWNIEINGDLIEMDGQPYYFGGKMPPPLKMLEKSRSGILGDREIILFGNKSQGFADSAVLGVVHLNDVVGKVILE